MFRSRLFTGFTVAATAAAAVSATALTAGPAHAQALADASAAASHPAASPGHTAASPGHAAASPGHERSGAPASPQSETEAGLIENYRSHLCLDVTDGVYRPGAPLQQWDCGARGGADQHFLIVKCADGTGALLARGPGGVLWGVAATGKGDQLILTPGRPDMLKLGSHYTFPIPLAPTLTMDVEDSSTGNGAHVIGWDENGGANQEWSNPIP
jgi:hypothetical protein